MTQKSSKSLYVFLKKKHYIDWLIYWLYVHWLSGTDFKDADMNGVISMVDPLQSGNNLRYKSPSHLTVILPVVRRSPAATMTHWSEVWLGRRHSDESSTFEAGVRFVLWFSGKLKLKRKSHLNYLKGAILRRQSKISWLLLPSMRQASNIQDPTIPTMQLNSIFCCTLFCQI